jgi:serine/threonine-protein kinase
MSRDAPAPVKGPPPPLINRVDQACDRFEAACLAGAHPRLEDYLPQAAGAERDAFLRELLILELAYRRRDGQTPTFEEYAARFPERVTLIGSLLGSPEDAAERRDRTLSAGPCPTIGTGLADMPLPASLILEVLEGPHEGRVFTFQEHDSFVVGRSPQAHFQLPAKDRYFSRMHFLVEFNPPSCRLMDLGSVNGTSVNGQKVTITDLKDGDLIQGGTTTIRVAVKRATAPAAPVAETVSYRGASTLPVAASGLSPTGAAEDVRRPVAPRAMAAATPRSDALESSTICRCCDSVLPRGEPGVRPGGATLNDLVCLDCRRAIEGQPQPFAGYQVVRELGRGGMGVVYLALRRSDGARCALKTIIPDKAATMEELARFEREARILCDLDHPNIVRCLDLGDSAGQLYFAMEFVPGCDATRLLKQLGKPMPVRRAVGLVCLMLDALAYAHARRFVHRDIKPSNLLISGPPVEEVLKLADFGLARVYQASCLSGLTLTGDIQGTPAFMPPEQITHYRDVTPAGDLYSAGATLYYLLTRKFVYDFPGRLELKILKILQDPPVPISARRGDLPQGLADVIDRSLARNPQDRFRDATAMHQALAPFLAGAR